MRLQLAVLNPLFSQNPGVSNNADSGATSASSRAGMPQPVRILDSTLCFRERIVGCLQLAPMDTSTNNANANSGNASGAPQVLIKPRLLRQCFFRSQTGHHASVSTPAPANPNSGSRRRIPRVERSQPVSKWEECPEYAVCGWQAVAMDTSSRRANASSSSATASQQVSVRQRLFVFMLLFHSRSITRLHLEDRLRALLSTRPQERT
jgi:hypothetical protein